MTVVLILIDGLRPDAIDAARSPAARPARPRRRDNARQSVMPSVTLPCHTSIFHSVPPARHGITVEPVDAAGAAAAGAVRSGACGRQAHGVLL